jgi:hypothetical protein
MAGASAVARELKEGQIMLNTMLHSSPQNSHSLAVIRRIIRCDECSPRQAAVCSVELRFFCLNHFVAYCYKRLEESEKALRHRSRLDSVPGFLRESATQAAKLLLIQRELQNMDRARLLDIVLWANELFYQVLSSSKIGAGGPFPVDEFVTF